MSGPVRDRPQFSAYFNTIIRGQERRRTGEEGIWSSGVAVPVDGADGAPDISLELGSGRADHVPEVDLVGQLGKGGQECLDGGIGTSGNEVLKLAVNFFPWFGEGRYSREVQGRRHQRRCRDEHVQPPSK